MSETTINYRHKVDGALVDATSVKLQSPDATFGVLRKDTNAVVVSSGTSLTKTATGSYSYSFDDPALNLFYRYFLRIEYLGGVTYLERDTSIPQADDLSDLHGRYASYNGMKRKYGSNQLNKWAGIDGVDDPDAIRDAITDAIEHADALIDGYLADGPYQLPFGTTPSNLAYVPTLVKSVANWLAGVQLYEAQGLIDFSPDTGQPTHRLSAHKKYAFTELGRIKNGAVRLFLDSGTELAHSANVPFAGVEHYGTLVEKPCREILQELYSGGCQVCGNRLCVC